MKKAYIIMVITLLPLLVFSQERFYYLYPGWTINVAIESENIYTTLGLDTLNYGYENTPIFNIIDESGYLLNSYRYVSYTIVGFSNYTSKSYSFHDDYFIASGVYREYTKSYILNPILMYFNNSSFYLDSIIDFKEFFAGRSTQIKFHKEIDNSIFLLGTVQINLDWTTNTFFGIYDPSDGSFSYEDYTRPNNCKMTPYQLHPAQDGGYIISTEQDMTYLYPERVKSCLVKTDAEGNEQWRLIVGNTTTANFRARVFDAPDGNYYVVWTDPYLITSNYFQPNPQATIRIAKLTDHGTFASLSEETDLRPELGNFDRYRYVIQDSYQDIDGNMFVIIMGDGGYLSSLVKIFANGTGAWIRSYKCFNENDEVYNETMLFGMSRTSDGGFMLTGEFRSDPGTMFPNGIQSALAIKVDSCGCLDAEGCNPHCGDSYLPQYIRMPQAEVYPNPAVDEIRIVLPDGNGSVGYNIKIYSTSGQLLMEENCLGSDCKSVQAGSSDYKSERAVGVGEF
ncbi:MAG: T9SS type A sorting domain-containing protein, partial [Bacteroidales bacterium]|nr:T9SS type A sorting domain-containing protein [Bacteroidales bacterium]